MRCSAGAPVRWPSTSPFRRTASLRSRQSDLQAAGVPAQRRLRSRPSGTRADEPARGTHWRIGGGRHLRRPDRQGLRSGGDGVCSARNVDLLRSIGADHIIDYTRDDLGRHDRRYDLIADLAGNRPLADLRRALRPKGTLVIIGGSGGAWSMGFGRTVRAAILSPFVAQSLRPFISATEKQDLVALREMIETQAVDPVIDRRYPLEATAAALDYVGERHTQGKTVVTIPGATRSAPGWRGVRSPALPLRMGCQVSLVERHRQQAHGQRQPVGEEPVEEGREHRVAGARPRRAPAVAVSPASTNPRPPGVIGICARTWAPQKASSTRPGRGVRRRPRPARRAGSRSRRPSARPSPGAPLPAAARGSRASRSRSRSSRSGSVRRRRGRCGAGGCGPPGCQPVEPRSGVGGEQHRPRDREQDEDDEADERRLQRARG